MKTEKISLFQQFIFWREKNIKEKHFILILSFIVGVCTASAAIILKSLIHLIQNFLTDNFNATGANYLYLVYPVAGILLAGLFVRNIVKDDISHGVTKILYSISRRQGRIRRHNIWSSTIASAITIGCGGSVGAEAPIVLTGSAIGSNLGQMFHLDNKRLMLLVGCGASAAIAGIFKAPIAGMVFTLEVLMVDLSMASILPILTASVTATCVSYILEGDASLFNFQLDSAWNLQRIPACVIFGIVCAAVSLYFMRMMTSCENFFAQINRYPYVKLLFGGIILSSLIFFFPVLYGEGYNAIGIFLRGTSESEWGAIMSNSLFYGHDNLLLVFVACVLLTKVFATSATNGAGGCGGTFAPSLFIGGFSGFLFARLWNINQLGVYIPEKNFTLLGMAGVMAGVMHAPLTGIFLIAEITGGYQLFIPLIIVSICSVLAISIFEPHSIYAQRLAREGKLLTHHTDKSILTLMSMNSVIDKDFVPVDPEMPLGKLVNTISKSHTSFIPVLDSAGALLGEIDVTKIRHIMFRTELYQRFTVGQIMTPVAAHVGVNDPMEEVMRKFESKNSNYMPVVDVNNRLIGYISRTRAYSLYRKMVADFSAE